MSLSSELISVTARQIFLIFGMELDIENIRYSTEPVFSKKFLFIHKVRKSGQNGRFSAFFPLVMRYLKNAVLDFPDFLHEVKNRYDKQTDRAGFPKKNPVRRKIHENRSKYRFFALFSEMTL